MTYRETFDDGPGGWFGWISNAAGPRRLEMKDSCAVSRSPWWIDYNHAPPGAGYLHPLYMFYTTGLAGEHHREVAGDNRFVAGGFSTNFLDARISVRLKGELDAQGAQLLCRFQATQGGMTSGWLLTGQPVEVTADWSGHTTVLSTDVSQWKCLGARHDRTDYYGELPLATVLGDVNTDILLVLHPLQVAPMGPIDGDPHLLRPEKDYPVWRHRLPEGYVMLDEVKSELA